MSMSNPLSDLQYNTNEYLMDIVDGNWFAKADLTHGFSVTARLGLHVDNTRLHSSTNPKYGQTASYGGENMQMELHQSALTHQYLLNYNNSFGKNNLQPHSRFRRLSLQVRRVLCRRSEPVQDGRLHCGQHHRPAPRFGSCS